MTFPLPGPDSSWEALALARIRAELATPAPAPLGWDPAWGPDPALDPAYEPVGPEEGIDLALAVWQGIRGPVRAAVPARVQPSIYTRHQPHSGRTPSPRKLARKHPRRRPDDPATVTLRDPRERDLAKLDLADVLEELSRRAEDESDYTLFQWWSDRAGALRDCRKVRAVPHLAARGGCGMSVVRPLACHTRGCPDCERARVGRLIARYDELAAAMDRPAFWSWTVRNVPRGSLEAALRRMRADFGRLRRRSLLAGGPCRWRWRDSDAAGELDGAPGHPCHPPIPALECGTPACVEGCTNRSGGKHAPGCDPGCPTRTGRHRSACLTHPPAFVHAAGCPPTCGHFGHRRRSNCPAFRHAPVPGGVVASDITWSEDAGGTWHPHLHALMDSPWIAWSEMRDTWQALTCHAKGCGHGWAPRCHGAWSVWVEAVPKDDPDRRHGAIREVLKYVGKPHGIVDSLDPDRIGEYLLATRRARLVTGWGSLYRIQDSGDEPERDELKIAGIFSVVYVPRICPNCGRSTCEDDWGLPFTASRLEAFQLSPGVYGWKPPPQPLPRPATGAVPPASTTPEAPLWTI